MPDSLEIEMVDSSFVIWNYGCCKYDWLHIKSSYIVQEFESETMVVVNMIDCMLSHLT
jgi:hypothetical protein